MSITKDSSKVKVVWDPIKERAPTFEFVNKYLHNRGLKCLTDGQVYFLDPLPNVGKRALPKLADLGVEVFALQVYVAISRTQEVDLGTKGSPYLIEARMTKTARECQYWEFFIEQQKETGVFSVAREIYNEEVRIAIDWCEPPEEEEEGEEATPLREFTAFDAHQSAASMVRAATTREVENPDTNPSLEKGKKEGGEASDIKSIMPVEAKTRYHIAPEYESVYDFRHHTFLVIGDRSYLCTNLFKLLRMPRNLMKTTNAELMFDMSF